MFGKGQVKTKCGIEEKEQTGSLFARTLVQTWLPGGHLGLFPSRGIFAAAPSPSFLLRTTDVILQDGGPLSGAMDHCDTEHLTPGDFCLPQPLNEAPG